MTTWQEINNKEIEAGGKWDGWTVGELKRLRLELLSDVQEYHSCGSHGDAESAEKDITEIEAIVRLPLTFPRWRYLVE